MKTAKQQIRPNIDTNILMRGTQLKVIYLMPIRAKLMQKLKCPKIMIRCMIKTSQWMSKFLKFAIAAKIYILSICCCIEQYIIDK